MCGIFGYVGPGDAPPGEVRSIASRLLRHRGPDDHGFESGVGWGLGFRRLSILDLTRSGHQPMQTPDGRFWIVFNGEIYNYIELRRALEEQGETFKGSSDTEVLVRLLARCGAAGLSQLNGMFALVIIDTVERTFLIARDRLGQKPIYYFRAGDQIRFASELKALLAWPGAPREVDPLAVAQYLCLEYLPQERCIFKGYQKLQPGHYLQGPLDHPAQAKLRSYWRLDLEGREGEPDLTKTQLEELQELLTDATRIRLRSDVPVGIFLSGGIDSGLVAALAAQLSGERSVRALTVGFAEESYDESALARLTAEHIGIEQQIVPQPSASLADVDRLAWFFDEPFGDPSAIPTFTLCEVASRYATVFVAGDGGDEAFGGYGKYTRNWRYRLTHAFPPLVGQTIEAASRLLPALSATRLRLARKSLPDGGFAAARERKPVDPVFELIVSPGLQTLATRIGEPMWTRWQHDDAVSATARWQRFDYAMYLPDDILVKVDRASMAHSIEVRSPFLDYRLVEWAGRLPRAALLNTRQGKLPLRALARRLLPPEVEGAGKRGFGAPLGKWFREPGGQAFARERLLSDQARRRGWWNPDGIEKVLSAHVERQSRDFGEWLWRLLMLDAWARLYLDSDDFLKGPP